MPALPSETEEERIERMRRRSDELFDYLDLDGSGQITIDEIQQLMTVWGEPLTTREIEALVGALDLDGDRALDAAEFRRLFDGALEAAGHHAGSLAGHAAEKLRAALLDEIDQQAEQGFHAPPCPVNDVTRPHRVNPALRRMEYAVRGEVERQGAVLAARLKAGERLAFDDLLMCNIGNPQAVGQLPLTFVREVLALLDHPALLERPEACALFAEDAVARARRLLEAAPGGTGAYSHSQGLPSVREAVARFIGQRDGFAADPGDVFLTDGASGGIGAILKLLITRPGDAVLTPAPQYPIYSATCASLNARAYGYFLDEAAGWDANRESLQRAYDACRSDGRAPKALVVINPGNPTGRLFRAETLAEIASFCAGHGLWLLADEVYQENVYAPGARFISARRAVREAGLERTVPLVSFHSVSKGVIGECGRRGGYMELFGVHPAIKAVLYKLASVGLCPNVAGQVAVALMVDPPAPGAPSHARHEAERCAILDRLRGNARLMETRLNALDGVACQPIEGAMYAFPRIAPTPAARAAAQRRGRTQDLDYCLSLLDNTGICAVPGGGFGVSPEGFHIRMTILPPPDRLAAALDRFAGHHAAYMAGHG